MGARRLTFVFFALSPSPGLGFSLAQTRSISLQLSPPHLWKMSLIGHASEGCCGDERVNIYKAQSKHYRSVKINQSRGKFTFQRLRCWLPAGGSRDSRLRSVVLEPSLEMPQAYIEHPTCAARARWGLDEVVRRSLGSLLGHKSYLSQIS